MRFDVDLHRYTLKLPNRLPGGKALEMSVVDAGDRDADQAIVFIHGFGGRAAYWHHQLENFQTDYRVVALDLRGHGYSDAPTEAEGARYDPTELVIDMEAALQALQIPEHFILICHSFGGALSSYFIHRHPARVTALVIIASAVRFKLRWPGRFLLRVPPRILNWVRTILPFFGLSAARIYPPAHVVYLQNKNALSIWDGTEYLRTIHVPTQVILGQRDILFSQSAYREVAKLVPNAEEVIIPVSAHQVMVERPDAVNRSIERFLQAQFDPLVVVENKVKRKMQRRAVLKALEGERPWLKFYDTRTPYRIKPPTVALPRLLEATARRFAKTPAVEYFGGQLDWRTVDRLANRFAHGLLALNLKPGDRVMLAMPNTPNWIIAYYGVLKIGGVAVLCHNATDTPTLLKRLVDTETVLLLADADRYRELRVALRSDVRAEGLKHVVFASRMDHMGWHTRLNYFLKHIKRLELWLPWLELHRHFTGQLSRYLKFQQVLTRGKAHPPEINVSLDDQAVFVYSSGRSGVSRPIALSHRNLASNALQLRHWLPESRPGEERFLAEQPLSLAFGLSGLLHLGVYLGATLILVPESDLALLLKTIRKSQPTFFPASPAVIHQLVQIPGVRRFGLASIRVCAVAGAPLALEIREMFEKITRGRLVEAYGLAEASPAVLAMPLSGRRQSGLVGLPLPDTEAKILNLDTGEAVAPDQLGELWVRGPQVGQPGWLATGDIASMDENGFFNILERKDNMLVRKGQRIFPRQIEEVLYEHPAIAMAKIIRTTGLDETVCLQAHVRLHRNLSTQADELMKYCSRRLPAGALPDSIHIA
jgi:long-chain acyl-CoA synthetase